MLLPCFGVPAVDHFQVLAELLRETLFAGVSLEQPLQFDLEEFLHHDKDFHDPQPLDVIQLAAMSVTTTQRLLLWFPHDVDG